MGFRRYAFFFLFTGSDTGILEEEKQMSFLNCHRLAEKLFFLPTTYDIQVPVFLVHMR